MSSITIRNENELRESPFLTLNFAVVGGNPSLRNDLCEQLIQMSAEPEFRHCTAAGFGSAEELAQRGPKVMENALSVVVVDTMSALNCADIGKWLATLRDLQFFGKVCIAIYNAHKVSERACSAEFLQLVRSKHQPTPVFFHGPGKTKWRPFVARILRWGEICAGLRGRVTIQYLRGVTKLPDASDEK